MFDKEKIQSLVKLYEKSLDSHNELRLLLLRKILRIDFNKIDHRISELKTDDNTTELRLFSVDNEPFIYVYIEKELVEIQIGQGAQFLELTNLRTSEDVENFELSLQDVFYSSFSEEIVKKGGAVISAKYSVKLSGLNTNYHFSINFPTGIKKMIKKKEISQNVYAPWLV